MPKTTRSFMQALIDSTKQMQDNHTRFVHPQTAAEKIIPSPLWAWKRFLFSLGFFWCGMSLLIAPLHAAYQQQILESPTQVNQWLAQCTKHVPQGLITETQNCFKGLTDEELDAFRTILLRRFQLAEFFMMCHGGTLKNFKAIVVYLTIYQKYLDNISPSTKNALNQFDATLAKADECPFSTITLFITKFSDILEHIQDLYELFQETCEQDSFQAIRDALDIGEAILQLGEGAQAVRLEPRQPFLQEEDLDAITFLGIDNTLILFANRASEARDILAAAQHTAVVTHTKDEIKTFKQGLNSIDKKIRELQNYFSSEAWRVLIDQTACFPDAYLNAKTTAVLINQADRVLQEQLSQYDRRILYPFHLMIHALESGAQKKLCNQYASALKNFIEYSTIIDFMEQVLTKIKTVWAQKSEMPLQTEHEELLWALGDTKVQEILPVLTQSTNKNQKKLMTLVRYYLSLLRIRLKKVAEYKEGGLHLAKNFGDHSIMPPVALYYFCLLRSILTGQNELFSLRTDVAVLNNCIFSLVSTFLQEEQEHDLAHEQNGDDQAAQLCKDLASLIQSEWKEARIKQAKKQSHEHKKSHRKQKRKKRNKK